MYDKETAQNGVVVGFCIITFTTIMVLLMIFMALCGGFLSFYLGFGEVSCIIGSFRFCYLLSQESRLLFKVLQLRFINKNNYSITPSCHALALVNRVDKYYCQSRH